MTRPDRTPDPLGVQERLLLLLGRAEGEPRLRAELARARREFFGADTPGYVDPDDALALDVAAQRFAEWFLIERVSDVLGRTPLEGLGEPAGVDAALAGSRTGLFLIESGGDEILARDLEDAEALTLVGVADDMRAGDVLVGRLFPVGEDAFVPSVATASWSRAPQIAVAFQRDLRRLDLGRRLDQAELERLVFQRWAVGVHGARPGDVEPDVPIERLEADLQSMLEEAGMEDVYSATGLNASLRATLEHPGGVIGPVLDDLAFESSVDLDRARELMLSLWNATRAAPPAPSVPPNASRKPSIPAAPPRAANFREQAGEHLGERLARRIEEGLGRTENADALFNDVERILGESVDEGDDEGDQAADSNFETGDLEPLIHEFTWEADLCASDEARLFGLVAAQATAPVPRLNVEYLDADDWFRWLLQIWLGAAPDRRASQLRAAFALAERFHLWLVDEHTIDIASRLEPARNVLLDAADRLQAAGIALGHAAGESPLDADPSASRLLRYVGRREDHLHFDLVDDGGRVRVPDVAGAGERLVEGDLVFGVLARDVETQPLDGPIAVVPADCEPLLG